MADTQEQNRTGHSGWHYRPVPPMDEAQFRQWQSLLESHTGMTLSRERKSFLETNLSIRLRELGQDSYQAYYQALMAGGPAAVVEWATLVDRLTVQETRFFRDPDAFRLIGDFARQYCESRPGVRNLSAWSLGCSSGEEAYSMAMVLERALKGLPKPPYFSVTGSDISQPALNKASAGVYSSRKLVTLDEACRQQYMEPLDEGHYRVCEPLRQRLCFTRINAMQLDRAPMHGMVIILCQNLLIYFRHWRRRQIVNALVELLAPGGLLVLGQGELNHWQHPAMQPLKNRHVMAWVRQEPKE
ncbi:MAG: protein-glutamate O-methyltransferase CheR [Oleiphilaceae bacterium]|nr:protein-glutamate O-methyltransferase CheR [Oleiphilaceae bacterium]